MNSKDDNNSGRLFKNSDDWTIIQQGKLIIENTEQRIIGVKRLNKDGKPIVELYRAIGTLKSNEDKQSEKSPDAKGVINKLLDKGALTISAWKETSDKGNAYTSLKCREFSNDYNQDNKSKDEEVTNQTIVEDSDEIPW